MARKKACKFGKLKSPRGSRVCRRKPRRGGRKARRTCKYGFKKGTRTCRKTRRVRRSRPGTRAAQEAAMWKAYRR